MPNIFSSSTTLELFCGAPELLERLTWPLGFEDGVQVNVVEVMPSSGSTADTRLSSSGTSGAVVVLLKSRGM